MKSRALARSSPASSSISAPPTKARPPAPVRIARRKSDSAASPAIAARNSPINARLRLLRRRSLAIVTRAMKPPSGRVTRSTSTAILAPHPSLVHTRPQTYEEASVSIVEDIREIREIYGEPSERVIKKQLPRLEKHSRAFIAMSPFLVMATCDAEGRCDASPKGDGPGFVTVVDDQTLLIPDRLGNNRVDTIGNILQHPQVGLIFLVPGIRETLRVNGRAQITTDPELLASTEVNGKLPRSGILVTADEVYFHCGKALIRSDLWNPEKHVARTAFPSLGIVIADQIGQRVEPKEAERVLEENYRTRLY